jgi:hypothetical protein
VGEETFKREKKKYLRSKNFDDKVSFRMKCKRRERERERERENESVYQ